MVSGMHLVVGKTISLAFEDNPIKAKGCKEVAPRLAQTFDDWRKDNPPTNKKLPVGIDAPDFW